MNTVRPVKPITIFLDVDGVINHLKTNKEWNRSRLHDPHWHECGAYWVYIPDHIPPMIQHLAEVAEIRWLTTWRDKANEFISPLLGIPTDLAVITDGTYKRHVDWKVGAARRVAAELIAEGRRVIWIEDFYSSIPNIPGIEYVDTGADLGLFPWHLDKELVPDELAALWMPDIEPEMVCVLCSGMDWAHEKSCPRA